MATKDRMRMLRGIAIGLLYSVLTMTSNTAPENHKHYVLGFNWLIDRIPVQRLLTTVGVAIEKGATEITLCMSSPGGVAEQALYAFEILRSLPITLTTHNVGNVSSAAVPLFLAGSKRLAVSNATFLMHNTVGNPGANVGKDHLGYAAKSIEADDFSMMSIVAERTGQPLAKVKTWFRGQQLRTTAFAKSINLIDDIASVEISSTTPFVQIVGI